MLFLRLLLEMKSVTKTLGLQKIKKASCKAQSLFGSGDASAAEPHARQAEDAQELAEQTRRDATAVAGHAELCEVLRRAAAGDALAADESSLLAQLQLAGGVHRKHHAEQHGERAEDGETQLTHVHLLPR